MIRSIVAVATGFILIFVLAMGTNALLASLAPQTFPSSGIVTDPAALVLALVYVGVYAVGGCYVAARLAPRHPMRHALVLGALGLAFNVLGVVMTWGQVPAWYAFAGLALTMPYAWIGGRIRERELERAQAQRWASV